MVNELDLLELRIKDLELENKFLRRNQYGLNFSRFSEDTEFYNDMKNNSVYSLDLLDSNIKSADYSSCSVIESDNLNALYYMNGFMQGSVDVIYIDPPYNTGKTYFNYHDKRVSSVVDGLEYENLSQLRGVNPEKHSAWLSFMERRLWLARRLLADNGFLFISIDDNEYARLKILCDSIFGEYNLISTFMWVKGGSQENSKRVSVNHEYILFYVKDKDSFVMNNVIDPNKTDSYAGRVVASCVKNGIKNPASVIELPVGFPVRADSLYIPAIFNAENFVDYVDKNGGWINSSYKKSFGVYYPLNMDDIVAKDGKLVKPVRLYSGCANKNKIERFILNNYQPFEDSNDSSLSMFMNHNGVLYYERSDYLPHYVSSVLQNFGYTTKSKKFLNNIGIDFAYPKPVDLVEYLISFHPNKNAKVLDFFAGSGTTGHAVASLNAKDGGLRDCILITHGFEKDDKVNLAKDVAYKRILSVYGNNSLSDSYEGNVYYYKLVKVDSYDDSYQGSVDFLVSMNFDILGIVDSIDSDGMLSATRETFDFMIKNDLLV